jgi:hypothetical protein
MKKKVKILMTLLAALLVGLLLVTACTNPTNGDPGAQGEKGDQGGSGGAGEKGDQGEQGEQGEPGGTGPEGKPGANVATITSSLATKDLIASYFANLVDTVVVVDDGSDLPSSSSPDDEYVVPPNKTLAIAGEVSLTGTTRIKAVEGKLDLSGGTIVGTGTQVVLLNKADALAANIGPGLSGAKIITAKVPTYMDNTSAQIPNADGAILPSLTIGAGGITQGEFDYFTVSGYPVYIIGNLTVNTATVFTSGEDITVYGDTKVGANITLDGAQKLIGKLVATAPITVTGLSAADRDLDTGSFRVIPGGGVAPVTLRSLDGTGNLFLDDTIGQVNIGGGKGNVVFDDGDVTLTAASTFLNSGNIVFNAGGLILDGSGAGTARFNGTVSIPDTKSISLVAGTNTITLDNGAALAVGNHKITSTAPGTVLTPGAGTTLGFSTANGITQAGTPGTQGINVAGDATLTGTYTVSGGTATTGGILSVATGGTLKVDGKLSLDSTGAGNTAALTTTGTGKVVAGDTTIAGAGISWTVTANTGKVDITPNALTASVAGAVLTPSGSAGIITVAAGKRLTVIGKLNFGTYGTLTLMGAAAPASPASLLLKGGTIAGNLTVGSGTNGVTVGASASTANFLLTPAGGSGATDASVTKADGMVVEGTTGGNATSGDVLGSIGGGAANDVLITAPATANNSAITAGWKVQVPNG